MQRERRSACVQPRGHEGRRGRRRSHCLDDQPLRRGRRSDVKIAQAWFCRRGGGPQRAGSWPSPRRCVRCSEPVRRSRCQEWRRDKPRQCRSGCSFRKRASYPWALGLLVPWSEAPPSWNLHRSSQGRSISLVPARLDVFCDGLGDPDVSAEGLEDRFGNAGGDGSVENEPGGQSLPGGEGAVDGDGVHVDPVLRGITSAGPGHGLQPASGTASTWSSLSPPQSPPRGPARRPLRQDSLPLPSLRPSPSCTPFAGRCPCFRTGSLTLLRLRLQPVLRLTLMLNLIGLRGSVLALRLGERIAPTPRR